MVTINVSLHNKNNTENTDDENKNDNQVGHIASNGPQNYHCKHCKITENIHKHPIRLLEI